MAIHEGYDKINRITGLDVPWEGKTGVEVEDFISRRLKNPLGSVIEYNEETLTIKNPEGEVIASGQVTVVPPTYDTVVSFEQLIIDNVVHTGNVEVNYTESAKFKAGINVKTYYESAGNIYSLSNKVNIVFSIEDSIDQYVVEGVIPNKYDDNSLQIIDITPLFQYKVQGRNIVATVTTANATGYDSIPNVTVHKIELSTSSTYVDNNTVVFNIDGLRSSGNMFLEYFDVLLGANPGDAQSKTTQLTGTSSTELTLAETGAHQIVARVTNEEHTFYSNWVQANVVCFDSNRPQEMMAIIGSIPKTIQNCENANLYKIIYVPGTGGEIEIVSYLTDEAGDFESHDDWSQYLFNQTTIAATSNDKPATSDYYSYIELTSVGSSQKAIGFKLKIDGVEYPIYELHVNTRGKLEAAPYFTIDIKENPHNVNNIFNYTEGAKDNFSQITGQATTLFSGINPDIEASDGWTVDDNLIAYKISGQNKELFTTPKDFSNLLNSGQGFSIEVMLKNYNINGDDPVMNIGNLLFGPGFSRVDSTDLSEEGIFVNSRADFEKEVITHLMFVYDPNYKPSTYINIYDQLFNENGTKYSDINRTYPILKVYVNGCINREIQLTTNELKNEDGFKLQICPKSSDLNLYIFRTYTRALNYEEIQKNFISSRTTSKEKKEIYDRNNILGSDGRISFYKSMLNHNVIVFVLPKDEKPLFFGNRKTTGDGTGPDGTGKSKATILVRYKDEKYKDASGRFTGGKYKAQGSSAKKYLIHNTQYSKGTFLSEEQIAAGITEGYSKYAIPTDPEGIEVKKLVGKVNYASSMQSHKQGATKLYDRAYKEIFPEGALYNGGKKACLEEAFMYFYYNVDDDSKLDTITMEDLYTTTTINNIVVANDSNVKFLGFQTWGSAKADDPTYGYDEDKTPEYVLLEGADNASPGANFHQPWAAFQTWDPTKTKDEHANGTGVMKQQTKNVTSPILNGQPNPNYDPTAGLLIEGETIQFENDTDPLDVDYGAELLILEGQTEKDAEKRDLWKFTDKVKNNSLPYFIEFYNNCYQFDFTNIIPNPSEDKTKFDLTNTYESTSKRIYMTTKTKLFKGDVDTETTSDSLNLYRWDGIKQCWVPAGLHYQGTSWETYNLKTVYNELTENPLYIKYKDNPDVIDTHHFEGLINSQRTVDEYLIPAFRDMFKATVEEYCDKNDIAYHQAFIKLVSGTDNRAKNTYFQIIGKMYEDGVKTDVGDYKVRLMQDDLDTIFATDNNGQQVKPYYLLEPPFNKATEDKWGDEHSSFFYPFDVCYYDLVNEYTGKLINHLFGSSTSIKAVDSNLYNYFFSVQTQFPEIAYNHHAEIYYEMPQVLFCDGEVVKENGNYVFPTTLNDFKNNNVKNPLSLSHGRCLESEYQFIKDRLIMLGTGTTSASGLYTTNEVSLSTEPTGGNNKTATFEGLAEFTDYLYPVKSVKTSGVAEYTKIVNIESKNDTTIIYDEVFGKILDEPGIPSVIKELVTPDKEFNISCSIGTTMGAYLSAGHKYKSINVIKGLDFVHSFMRLPNAKRLTIDGNTANYSIAQTNIVVRDYLPVIETLVILNTSFNNTVLDFRGCTRLEHLNLSGCSGIIDIIFPETNRLKEVYLPTGLQKLTLGNNPNLAIFEFSEGTRLTSVSLDCQHLNDNFDYMDILENRIDYGNLTQLIIKNTPENGLNITENVAMNLASVVISGTVSVIKGKFNILTRRQDFDPYNNVIYTWGSPADISYNTKKYLVSAFGNIDSEDNQVVFTYKVSTLLRNSYKLSELISIDAPTGGKFKPFDSLYFTSGNSVGIDDDGFLNIFYKVYNLPSGCSVDSRTGEVTIKGNTNSQYKYEITVTLNDGSSLSPIVGNLYLGYIEPAIGDYAYSDGTFSSILNSDKTLVGLVFQKETVVPGEQWKLGILSNQAVYDYAGPDYYHWNIEGNQFSSQDYGGDQSKIYNFMTSSYGLNISMAAPNTDSYLGFSSAGQTISDDTIVDKNYLDSSPTSLVTSGEDDTHRLMAVGLSRLQTIAAKSPSLLSHLRSSGFIDAQGTITNEWTHKDMDAVYKKFNDGVRNELNFTGTSDYYKVLHPLAIKVGLFTPDNLSGKGINYYSKNWYIPSKEEIELLVWYRIKSTITATTENTQANWNSTNYIGQSLFSDKYVHFNSFLSGPMFASNVSTSNKNFVYGEVLYYSGSNTLTSYGWFYNYTAEYNYWSNQYHQDCRRDVKYSVTPCCSIVVTKES